MFSKPLLITGRVCVYSGVFHPCDLQGARFPLSRFQRLYKMYSSAIYKQRFICCTTNSQAKVLYKVSETILVNAR